MAGGYDKLSRLVKILIAISIVGVLIWTLVPKEMLYLSIGIAVVVIGMVSYLVYRKRGIGPFKQLGKKALNKITEEEKQTQMTIDKVSPLSENERAKLINAVGNRCENPTCRHRYSLDVHHIKPKAEGGTNNLKNLIVLCPNCHRDAGRGAYSRAQLKEWIFRPKRFKFHFDWQYK